jgi:hypothetical protein
LLYTPSGFSLADSRVEGWDDLVSVYYRLEVCNYCGLTNEKAAKGFTIARDTIIQNHKITPELLDSARAEAWKAGYREWDNRGLGGFRRWCAIEGASYVEYFIGVFDQADLVVD